MVKKQGKGDKSNVAEVLADDKVNILQKNIYSKLQRTIFKMFPFRYSVKFLNGE